MAASRNLLADIAVIILTYQGKPWIEACLLSLFAAGIRAEQITVVDNASTDTTCAIVQAQRGVQLVRTNKNLGFAAGNNIALRRLLATDVRYLMLLNQDVRVEPDCFTHLHEFASRREPGLFAPIQLTYDGAGLDPSMREGILSQTQAFMDDLWNGKLAEGYKIPVAYGGALLIHRSVFEKVGLFDECYFLYGEDEDLCRRAVRAGFSIWLVPRARVYHWHTLVQTERNPGFEQAAYMRRARIIHALKNPDRSWSSRLASTALALTADALHGVVRGDLPAMSRAIQDGHWILRNAIRIKRSRDRERRQFANSHSGNADTPAA